MLVTLAITTECGAETRVRLFAPQISLTEDDDTIEYVFDLCVSDHNCLELARATHPVLRVLDKQIADLTAELRAEKRKNDEPQTTDN